MFAILGLEVPDQPGQHPGDFVELGVDTATFRFGDVPAPHGHAQLRSRLPARPARAIEIQGEMPIRGLLEAFRDLAAIALSQRLSL